MADTPFLPKNEGATFSSLTIQRVVTFLMQAEDHPKSDSADPRESKLDFTSLEQLSLEIEFADFLFIVFESHID